MYGATAPQADLRRLLRPRSIAVFGGRAAVEVIRQNRHLGFDGEIWPVHPQREEVGGQKAYRSVDDLPQAPDAAFLGVNRHLTIEIVAALAARGAGGAVAYASGFSETGGAGTGLQTRLVRAAGAMPFLGPNCYGLINYFDGALLWPDQHGGERVERGAAIITQSGNIGLNLTMQKRGLPIGYIATLGNQATIGVSVMIEALLDDARVTAIGLHIEGIDDPVRFAHAAARARRQRIPLVALKVGRSQVGSKLTVSHTASIAGADAAVDSFLRKVGVVRVYSIPVLLEALKLLHVCGPLSGRDIASLSCSGGEAALIADAAESRGVRFRPLDAAQTARVAATLPELVAISNPLDYHTFHWGNEPALTETFAAMMAANYDMTVLLLDFPRLDRCSDADWRAAVRALIAASQRSGRKAAIVATLPEALPEDRAKALIESDIVPLFGIEDALSAIEAAAVVGELARRADPVPFHAPSKVGGKSYTLTEWEGKRALAAYGLTVPDGYVVDTPEKAVLAAKTLGFPVVAKAVGAGIAHKTEIGAVKLDLRDAPAVNAAVAQLRKLGDSVLIERMVIDAVAELIVGINRDRELGLTLVIGSGGVLVDLIGDSRLLLLPAAREEILEAIASLKVSKLLDGHRGGLKGDMEATVAAILAIQAFAVDNSHRLLELDVNPLVVCPTGRGAVAVDVLVRFGEEDSRD